MAPLTDWAGPHEELGRYIAEESQRTLDSYRAQPNYVTEHANLEADTASGGYQHRQLYELVQNGADALAPASSTSGRACIPPAPRGGRIEVWLADDCLYCADDGAPIDEAGVRALMFSHMSPKRATSQIGTFGVGFKSLLGVSDAPEFLSRSGSFRFDRNRSRQRIREVVGARAAQLRISRLWRGQERPLPVNELHVVVATLQTAHSRLSNRGSEYDFLKEFKLVVFDEAHRSIAPTSTTVLGELGLTFRTRRDEPFLLGLTATPYRGHDEAETARLVNRYGRNRLDAGAFDRDDPQAVIEELQSGEVLARADHELIDGGTFRLSTEELATMQRFARGPAQPVGSLSAWLPSSAEDRIARDAERTRRIIDAFDVHIKPDWPTLVFATSVEHAQTVSALLNRKGITARAVSGETEHATRRRVVEQFREGKIQALVNYAVFREGFDAPRTRAIIVARPVCSPNLYFQMIGRGLRGPKNGGNDRCLILNVRDNIENFSRALAFSELDWLWAM